MTDAILSGHPSDYISACAWVLNPCPLCSLAGMLPTRLQWLNIKSGFCGKRMVNW